MDRYRFETRLALLPPDRVSVNAPLGPLTTFRVGGPADWLVIVRTVDELSAILSAARESGVPITLLGGGSNVLVSDHGVRGVVIRMQLTGMLRTAPDRARAEAGATINGLVRWMISRGLGGLEAWAGTPGTVGGAIFGNAHFRGYNISDLVTDVMLVTPRGEFLTAADDDMEFAYDWSRLRRTHEIVVWAEFAVAPTDPEAMRQTARESLAYRKRTQPLAVPSAGCIFQNPDSARDGVPDDVPASAGALIDRAGLKGHRIGGASISPVHANFIVNHDRASAKDIRALIDLAREAVHEKFGVELRDEIVFLGEF